MKFEVYYTKIVPRDIHDLFFVQRAATPHISYMLDGLPLFLEVYIKLGRDYLAALPGKGKELSVEMVLEELFRFYSLH